MLAFLPLAKIDVATSVCTGCSNMSLTYCIYDYSNPSSSIKEHPIRSDGVFFYGGEGGICLHFSVGKNRCSNQCLHWLQQYATGILHL